MYFKRLKSICESKVKDLGDKYKERLDDELLRVLDWDKHGLKKSEELMKKRLFVKGAETNKSGSLILFLLGISKIDPIKDDLKLTEVVMVQGDMPDIDTDFLPEIRQGVKRKIVEKYGKQFTCSIGAYGNFKTKKAILEAAGVLSYDIQEAMRATKQMDSLADHEMEDDDEDDKKLDSMTFDEISHSYPDFGTYLAKYPDVRQHAEAIRGQISNMSKHAGGVIISSADVTKIVPLILDKDGDMVSCWTEGAASQELSIKGLIKYDILGLNSLEILKECCNIIREREQVNLNSLNIPISDKIAIKKSSKKDLLGIFQMESPATKPIADEVVLEDLNDIAALTSLIRPGPKNEGLDMLYAKRKHGEPYELHDKLKPILGSTYGVMTYQEQCLKRGSKVNTLYGQYSIERIRALFDIGCFIPVQCRDELTGADFYHEPEAVLSTGKKSCLKIALDDGCIIEVTPDHKIFTSNRGYVKASDLTNEDDIVTDKRQFN